jgi:hypothetical protein
MKELQGNDEAIVESRFVWCNKISFSNFRKVTKKGLVNIGLGRRIIQRWTAEYMPALPNIITLEISHSSMHRNTNEADRSECCALSNIPDSKQDFSIAVQLLP